MRISVVIFLFLHLFISEIFAQDCPSQTVYLTSEEEIDAFIQTYPDCVNIKYALIIEGPDIVSLQKLSFLKGVYSYLSIRNTGLINLEGLESLKRIGKALDIQDNEKLETISQLQITSDIYFQISIVNNPMLKSLEGLEEVTYTAVRPVTPDYSRIAILDNPQLNFCNLDNICQFLDNNNALYSVAGNGANCKFRESILESCGLYPKPITGDLVMAEGFENLDNEATPMDWYNVFDVGPDGPNMAEVNALTEGESALWLSSNIPHFEGHWDSFVWGRFPDIYPSVDIVLTLKCTGVGYCEIRLGQTSDNTGYNSRTVWNRPAGDEGVYTVYLTDVKVNEPFKGFGAVTIAATPIKTGLGTMGISEFIIDDLKIYANGELVNIDVVSDSPFSIFPNPTTDRLYFDVENEINYSSIEIFNLNGALLRKQRFSNSLDVSDLPEGMYIVQLSGAKEARRSTFVKM